MRTDEHGRAPTSADERRRALTTLLRYNFSSLLFSSLLRYNYCYSTCLGPVDGLRRTLEPSGEGRVPLKYGCLDMSVRGLCTAAELVSLPLSASSTAL